MSRRSGHFSDLRAVLVVFLLPWLTVGLHSQPRTAHCQLYAGCPTVDAKLSLSSQPSPTPLDFTDSEGPTSPTPADRRRESLLELRRSLQEILLTNTPEKAFKRRFVADNERRVMFLRIGSLVCQRAISLGVGFAAVIWALVRAQKPDRTAVVTPSSCVGTMKSEVVIETPPPLTPRTLTPDNERRDSDSSIDTSSRETSPRSSRRKQRLSRLKVRFSRKAIIAQASGKQSLHDATAAL
eukprot:m.35145 g.35145  ORF g.35145 m.35145 type:complete len:239 (+) comp7413_c0_seq1:1561-2277(+)